MTRGLYIVIGAVVVAVAAYFLFFAHNATTITNYPSAGTDIIAFGDSLVAGYGASEGHDFVSDLSKDIGQPVVNLGVDGDTTSQALARIHQLDKYNPKVVIVLVGGNDYLKRQDMTQAFLNLGQIIEYVHSKGAVVLLVGVRLNPFLGNFDKQYDALVSKYKVAYVPNAMDGILGNQKFMSDEVHPNDVGYAMLASRLEPKLLELIK